MSAAKRTHMPNNIASNGLGAAAIDEEGGFEPENG
jgi:hypothetical protein